MHSPAQVSTDPVTGKRLLALSLASLAEWPAVLPGLSSPFGLFLACDAREISDDVLRAAAQRVVGSRACYACAWGPACERVHDALDLGYARAYPHGDGPPFTTTWHHDDSLDEALWFFVNTAWPDADAGECRDWLAVSVARTDWSDRIRLRLADLDGLRAAVAYPSG